jgi:hypothetical protein
MQSIRTRHEDQRTDPERLRLVAVFLDRLCRLTELEAAWNPQWGVTERRLLEFALYSTYQDCVGLGLRPIARAMLGLSDPHQ